MPLEVFAYKIKIAMVLVEILMPIGVTFIYLSFGANAGGLFHHCLE